MPKGLPSKGIFGWDSDNETWVKVKVDSNGQIQITSTQLTTIDGYHDVPSADATTNAQMRDVVGNKSDAAQTTVGTTRSTIAYIKGILNQLASATYGLSALNTDLDAILVDTGTDIPADFARVTCQMDFWSDIVEEIQIGAGDESGVIAMGDVVVADIPSGVTITRVVAMFICRSIENTNASANAVDVSTGHIEVKESSAGTYTTAIDIPDNAFGVAASTREMGTVLIGDNDIASEVDANGTYTFELDDIGTDQDYLNFNDCQFGLRVYYII